MASATKTNERPGTRAQAKYVRASASKARQVLDLVRGEPVSRAYEILEFSDRAMADVVLSTLESAVANAEHNDELPADELYVSACYADEGPTLRRWRPRARGRATRINKQTCHITVIVSRFSAAELETLREREESRGARAGRAAAEARRRRVEKSRQQKADKRAAEEAEHEHEHEHEHDDTDEPDETATATAEAEAGTEDAPAGSDDTENESGDDDTETDEAEEKSD